MNAQISLLCLGTRNSWMASIFAVSGLVCPHPTTGLRFRHCIIDGQAWVASLVSASATHLIWSSQLMLKTTTSFMYAETYSAMSRCGLSSSEACLSHPPCRRASRRSGILPNGMVEPVFFLDSLVTGTCQYP